MNYAPCALDAVIGNPRPDFLQLHKTLRREKADYVPLYELYVDRGTMEVLLEKKLPDRASTVEFYHRAGYDYVPAWPGVELETGSLIDTSSRYPIENESDFEAYRWPHPDEISYSEFDAIRPLLPDGMKIIGQSAGIFEHLQMLMGYVKMCYALFDAMELVQRILQRIGELYVAMYEGMASIDSVGALVISDDLGHKSQTLIGATQIRQLILPWYKKLADIAHRHGKPCILHSCGQIYDLMDDLIDDVGIDAKHSYEDQILPVTDAYARYGSRLAILGGFDLDRLCRSTTDEVRSYTHMLMETLGSRGGYALGSGNSIPEYVPQANYLAMIGSAWDMRISLSR